MMPDIVVNDNHEASEPELGCAGCKYSSFYYQRFDNQYVCLKRMDKWGRIPEDDLKGHRSIYRCDDWEERK